MQPDNTGLMEMDAAINDKSLTCYRIAFTELDDLCCYMKSESAAAEGIRKRDRHVLDRCVSLGIPVAAVVGGGYDKNVDALARRHAIVHEEAAFVWRKHEMWKRAV